MLDIRLCLVVTFLTLLHLRGVDCLNVTVLTLIAAANGRLPYHIGRSGAAVDMAIEKLQSGPYLPPDVHVNVVQDSYDPNYCARDVAALTAKYYYTYNLSALVGPGCSLSVEVVGRMAASWNLPIISPVATNGLLGNKNEFPTLTRLAYNMNKWAQIYLSLFELYEWEDIAIIYDTSYVFFFIVGTSLKTEFESVGKRVYRQFFNASQPHDLERLVKKASERSRVFVLAVYGDDLRRIMLIAQRLGMTNGEYVFIFAQVFKGDGVGDTSWRRGDEFDYAARKAYETVLITQPRRPDTSEFLTFEQEVKDRALSDYSYTYGDAEVNVFISAFHDSFIIYAHVLNETLANGENFQDGRLFNSKIWGKTFKGISGDMAIDENGDRDMDFSLLDMYPDTGNFQVVGNYFGIYHQILFDEGHFIHWPDNKGPPKNTPLCGFLGDNPECEQTGTSKEVLIGSIFAATVVLFSAITFAIYRKFKMESDLQSQWWRVSWRDVVFVQHGSHMSSKLSSLQSSLKLGSKAEAIVTAMDVAVYRGNLVVVTKLHLNGIKIDRSALLQLRQMREMNCANLTKFYGLCTEDPDICFLTEHCTRGTLQDMLHNEAIKLDKDFKLSLTNDIITGMCYIQSTGTQYHGRLNSANCVIDGRFVLKITDYGLNSLRQQQRAEPNFNQHALLYVAPEHLRTDPLKVFSQPGDVYSFAVVLFELLTRFEPYEQELDTWTVAVLLDRIRQQRVKPIRPSFFADDNDANLLRLMSDCWQERPESRPQFIAIRKRIKEEFPSTAGSNILDTLLQRMEQYANNLEGLVDERTQAFLEEKRKAEELLFQILPKSVADRLKNGQVVNPEAYEAVTIYFSDIVGFTMISALSSPMEVIDLLNDLYTCFDAIIENFDVYKVETIGDAYMVVSGLPVRNKHEHVVQIARMSLSILQSIHTFKIRHLPTTQLQARIGIHTGPVCAGVVGRKMPRYCLFGDTVNTASRMESHSEAMKIHISDSTMKHLFRVPSFVMEERGELEIKGKGTMFTYWLTGEKGVPTFKCTL